MTKKKPITFKATKRKPRVVHVDFGSKKKPEEVCTQAISCQKCPDYKVGDPFGSCKRFGYGVDQTLAKRQKVCE
jgi:hypothetical protein